MILILPESYTTKDRKVLMNDLKLAGISASPVNKRLFKETREMMAAYIRSYDDEFDQKHTLLQRFINKHNLSKINPS